MKVLFGMALRQTTGFVESLLRLVGLDWTVPDFSTLSRRQKTLAVNIPYRGSKGPLHLLIDSTGIKVEGEGEWHARKHGGPKRRVWRKIHLGIDEETLEIRAVEITGSHIGDAPILPDLLDQIPEDQEIGSVTADGAYDTRKCHDAIADRGAHAVIPPRKNANPARIIAALAARPVSSTEAVEKDCAVSCDTAEVAGPVGGPWPCTRDHGRTALSPLGRPALNAETLGKLKSWRGAERFPPGPDMAPILPWTSESRLCNSPAGDRECRFPARRRSRIQNARSGVPCGW